MTWRTLFGGGLVVLGALVGLGALSCSSQSRGGDDSVTHFLKTCDRSSECGDLACICGVCTETCDSTTECLELQDNARCQNGSSVCASAPASEAVGVCTLRCESHDDCQASGLNMRCEEERCVQLLGVTPVAPPEPPPECAEGTACSTLSCKNSQYVHQLTDDCCRCDYLPECASGDSVLISNRELAERLSTSIFGQAADEAFLERVTTANPSVAGEVGCFAREMLSDPKAEVGVGNFFERWLTENAPDTLFEDPETFPQYSPDLEAALRQEIRAFGTAVVFDGEGLISPLLNSRMAFVNEASAPLYGLADIAGAELRRVELPEPERAGLLTRGFFLAAHGRDQGVSIVQRGVAMRVNIHCQSLPAPPTSVDTTLPDPVPGATPQTPKEQVVAHAANPACSSCHRLIDPLGIALGNFDGRGLYRSEFEGIPIDTSELYDGGEPFETPAELMTLMADSEQVQACAARQWLRYALNDDPATPLDGVALGTSSRGLIRRATIENGFSLREMISGATESELFLAPQAPRAER